MSRTRTVTSPPPQRALRLLAGEALVFAAATVLLLVHALDDAFVHRGSGLALDQHALAASVALEAGIVGIVLFGRLRAGLRAALAFTFGALATVNGGLHAVHVLDFGPAGGDVTGLLALGAGVVLLGLAGAIPLRHRGEGRRATRAVAVVGGVLGVLFVLGPVGLGIVETHKWREPVGAAPGPEYQDVAFDAADGLDIAGWYRPSRNGAAVLVLHGGGSDRRGAVAHARMLAGHGYGVLLYDARGRGESDGTPNGFGWDWPKDVAGALKFLRERDDVRPGRIGAVGLSTGADVLIEAAARQPGIAALVSDGAAAGSFQDWHHLRGNGAGTVPGWMMFTAMRVLSGDRPGPPLEEMIVRVRAPTLLISAGQDVEREFNVLYERASNGRAEHWNLPRAQHTHAIHQERAAYEQRVVGFLDDALL